MFLLNLSLFCHLLFAFFLLLVSGCASLSKKDCQEGNWVGLGHADAQLGKQADSQLVAYHERCGKFDVSVNEDEYQTGYDLGLQKYCTTHRGFDLAYPDKERREYDRSPPGVYTKYLGVCPAELEPDFLTGYLSGLTENCQAVINEYSMVEAELNAVEDDDSFTMLPSALQDTLQCGDKGLVSASSIEQDIARKYAYLIGLTRRSVAIAEEIERWRATLDAYDK